MASKMFTWPIAALIGAALVGCGGNRGGTRPSGSLIEPPPPSTGDQPAARGESGPLLGGAQPAGDLHASNADRPRVGTPAARTSVEDFRPSWWFEEPEAMDGVIRVGAMGEGRETLDARREAVRAASLALRGRIGHDPRSVETERYTVVQLGPGNYRAFILMSGRE